MLVADRIKKKLEDKELKIGKYVFTSRLFVGTGKYTSMEVMAEALEASGAEVLAVVGRRINI